MDTVVCGLLYFLLRRYLVENDFFVYTKNWKYWFVLLNLVWPPLLHRYRPGARASALEFFRNKPKTESECEGGEAESGAA